MTGVILAGGRGTRLDPLTRVANKHLLPIFDKPMIYYPIQTLKDLGCEHVIIVSGGEHVGGFAELLQDGSEFGITISYRVQNETNGIAGALLMVEGLVKGIFPVILGDNIFAKQFTVRDILQPTIFVKKVEDPWRFGVYAGGAIIEKPENPLSNLAVVGMYVYDDSVFEFIKTLEPSSRGELEVSDINSWYLANKRIRVKTLRKFWSDAGTFDSLLRTANYIRDHRQGKVV
jgi:glucose-1-phosphate thymidylyltransferase